MNTVLEYILWALQFDMMTHEMMAQCVRLEGPENGPQLNWQDVLEELLLGEVEIGTAKPKTPNSLDSFELIGWRGSVSERVARAVECVNNITADPSDPRIPHPGLYYCISLRQFVGRYEGEEQQESDQNS